MGSRGWWKPATNYIESDFEIAVVAPQEIHALLLDKCKQHFEQQGYNTKALITMAGLCFMEIKNYNFGDNWINKFEICFQTKTQNNAIKNNYLYWLKDVSETQLAWYISSIRDAKDNIDHYNLYKEWLRIL